MVHHITRLRLAAYLKINRTHKDDKNYSDILWCRHLLLYIKHVAHVSLNMSHDTYFMLNRISIWLSRMKLSCFSVTVPGLRSQRTGWGWTVQPDWARSSQRSTWLVSPEPHWDLEQRHLERQITVNVTHEEVVTLIVCRICAELEMWLH